MTTKSRVVKLASKDLSLEDGALALLRAVDSNVRVFTSDGETPEALADFEQSVRLLRMMEDRLNHAINSTAREAVEQTGARARVIKKTVGTPDAPMRDDDLILNDPGEHEYGSPEYVDSMFG
jgi:hypothetical protein